MKEIARRLVGNVWRTGVADEGGNGGSQTVSKVTIPLSSADILALFTSPKTLVVGEAGKLIIPLAATVTATKGTTYYTVADQDLLVGLYIADKGNGFPNFEGLLSSGGNGSRVFADVFSLGKPANFLALYGDGSVGGADPLDWNQGQDLVIMLPNSDPSGGDGTADVTVTYFLAP